MFQKNIHIVILFNLEKDVTRLTHFTYEANTWNS